MKRRHAGYAISEVAELCRLMDGDSIIYGGLRGPQDLVPASTRYAERPRSVTTWRSDNVEAEQLERAEKARYGGEIGRDTAARQRTSRIYTT